MESKFMLFSYNLKSKIMKIIDECPICKKDFMYDPNADIHLMRNNMPLNSGTLGLSEEDLEDHDVTYFICQEWDEKETKKLMS